MMAGCGRERQCDVGNDQREGVREVAHLVGESSRPNEDSAADEKQVALEARRQRLKQCMDASATLIMQQEAEALGMTLSDSVVGAIRDCVFAYAEQLAGDLKLFAKHANRNKVTAADVLLAARRNEAIVGRLREVAAGLGTDAKGSKKRKVASPMPP